MSRLCQQILEQEYGIMFAQVLLGSGTKECIESLLCLPHSFFANNPFFVLVVRDQQNYLLEFEMMVHTTSWM